MRVSFWADSCTAEFPAHSSCCYWIFTRNGKHIERVREAHLLDLPKVKRLYGRPWLKQFAGTRVITVKIDEAEGYGGLPDDVREVWRIFELEGAWVVECPKRAILHIMNNPERTARGETFEECLKKLFEGKRIFKTVRTVRTEEIT